MRVAFRIVFFVVLFSLLSCSTRAETPHKQIEKLLKSRAYRGIDASLEVVLVRDGQSVYEHQKQKNLIPASNMKLVTTAAALRSLGPKFTFKTKVYTDGRIKNGVLQGNLYIKGFGDPLFVSERMWYLINDLTREGFRSIQGDLILDESYFDSERETTGEVKTGEQRAYSAPLSALSLNFNVVAIYVRPGPLGKKPIVIVDPDSRYIRVENKAITGKKNTVRVLRIPSSKGDIIRVEGVFPRNLKEKRFYRNVSQPILYFGETFRSFLKDRGIHLSGKIRKQKTPRKAQEILTYESRQLREIARENPEPFVILKSCAFISFFKKSRMTESPFSVDPGTDFFSAPRVLTICSAIKLLLN